MDFASDFVKEYCKNLSNNLESQIVDAFKKHGYEFETKAELEEFASNRCYSYILDGVKYLTVEGKCICCWTDYKMDEYDFTNTKEPFKISYSYNFQVL